MDSGYNWRRGLGRAVSWDTLVVRPPSKLGLDVPFRYASRHSAYVQSDFDKAYIEIDARKNCAYTTQSGSVHRESRRPHSLKLNATTNLSWIVHGGGQWLAFHRS